MRTEGLDGWPATDLINKADEWKADLVVVGSRGRSAVGRFILGSVSKMGAAETRRAIEASEGPAVGPTASSAFEAARRS